MRMLGIKNELFEISGVNELCFFFYLEDAHVAYW